MYQFFQINNAGVAYYKPLTATNEEEYDDLFNTNVRSQVFLTKLVLPYLIQTKGMLNNLYVDTWKGMRCYRLGMQFNQLIEKVTMVFMLKVMMFSLSIRSHLKTWNLKAKVCFDCDKCLTVHASVSLSIHQTVHRLLACPIIHLAEVGNDNSIA